jgi:hypothetical protein
VRSESTASGVRRSGDYYQDIIALDILVEMLEHPDRFQWARVEADDAGFLDDIVALRENGVIVAKQVKFSAHPSNAADPYSWDKLLAERTSKQGKPLPSLLAKWGKSFRALKGSYSGVEAILVSNRRPGEDLRSSFAAAGVVDLNRISDSTVRDLVVVQLGGEVNAREFFSAFQFELDQPSLETFEAGVQRRFMRMGGDLGGWNSLKDELGRWIRDRNSPAPDGAITLAAVKSAARWHHLATLPEEFAVPPDFVIPDKNFHRNVLQELREMASGCVVLAGPPGIGKSTYISNLYRELRDRDFAVVRHHFFLSRDDPTPFRYDHLNVASSLMSELQTLSTHIDLAVRGGNPRAEELPAWLAACGREMSKRGSRLVVILDGLDHVWRDAGSITQLDHLFQLLTPIPPGVVLVIGTQPVDVSQLPRRLSEVAPRQTWLDLPAMDYLAVRRWAEFHAVELRAVRNGNLDSHALDNLSIALWKRSEGHPLHLQYLLKSLDEVKGYIVDRDIERLPDAPHRDIARYYERFWEDLPGDSKRVLCLLAMCDFPWSRSAIAQCLDPANRNLEIETAIQRVTHLTAKEPLGIQFVHSSLQFFVRQHADYQTYAESIREAALDWLRTRAPDFFRWSYEWLLAAESGDAELLLRGPSRSWVIEGMARRYPIHTADRILTRCAWIALQKGDLDRFAEVALLSDYLYEAGTSRDNIMERLLGTQLIVHEDSTLADRIRGDVNALENAELLQLAEYYQKKASTPDIKVCFDRLNGRFRSGQEFNKQNDGDRCLVRIAAFAPGIDPRNVLEWLGHRKPSQIDGALWRDYTESLRAHRQLDRLRMAIESSKDQTLNPGRALSCLVLLACEDGFDPLTQEYSADSSDPVVIVARALRSELSNSELSVRVPEPWILRLSEHELFQHYDEMAEYLWRMFFVFTANCILGREEQNRQLLEPFVEKGWISDFIDCSAAAGHNFAQRLKFREPTKYSWIFDQFAKVRQPSFISDRAGHGFAVAARKALLRLALDLLALQAGTRSPAIQNEDIEIARRIPLFHLQTWLEITLTYRRSWLAEDALVETLNMIESELNSTIEDFGSRAELCALAAEMAASHCKNDAAARWVRECWSNLLAYGNHKDMLLDQCLDAAGHLQEAGLGGEAMDILTRLAPAVSAIGDYTDGDETRHLPVELGRLLLMGDVRRFVKYHEWLCASGDYWDASSIFRTFVVKADLGNRLSRAVAQTAIERENLATLSERSDKGDSNAAECLRTMSLFQACAPAPITKAESAADRLSLKENGLLPDVREFPPERFEAYQAAVKTSGSYRVDENIDAWARFWSTQGDKKAVLEALEAYDRDTVHFFRDSKLRFELTMGVRGKQSAYQVLVTAQQGGYGWNSYFSRPENALYVWTKLKEIYPDKWLAFLQSTLMSDPSQLNRSGVTVRFYISRLVKFLLLMERPEVAKTLARTAINAALQLVPLNLPPQPWIGEEVQ